MTAVAGAGPAPIWRDVVGQAFEISRLMRVPAIIDETSDDEPVELVDDAESVEPDDPEPVLPDPDPFEDHTDVGTGPSGRHAAHRPEPA